MIQSLNFKNKKQINMKAKNKKKLIYTIAFILVALLYVFLFSSCKKETIKPVEPVVVQPWTPDPNRTVRFLIYTRDTITGEKLTAIHYVYTQIWKDSIGYERHYSNLKTINCKVGDTLNLVAGLTIDNNMTNKTKYICYELEIDYNFVERDSTNFLMPGDSYLRKKFIIK